MSRSFARILVIAIVCMSVALLAGKTLAAARGDSPVWTTSGPGATSTPPSGPDTSSPSSTPSSGPDASSPSSMPANGSSAAPGMAPGASGNGPAGVEAPGSEAPDASEPNANEAGEQEIVGSVASINADKSTFTLNTSRGSIEFAITNLTEFDDGLTGLSSLSKGMSVQVDSVSQSAGHLVATKVKGPSDNGSDSSDSNS